MEAQRHDSVSWPSYVLTYDYCIASENVSIPGLQAISLRSTRDCT
jgi:hypothetical protein